MAHNMDRARNISKSMMAYLKRARDHKDYLLKETLEFERGKRHLANMMGVKAEEMTQDDIDKAIEYLFPSGLFAKRARPIMKHPDLLHKAQKEAQFDIEGRPHHYLFYTACPNYQEALVEVRKNLKLLNDTEDKQLALGVLNAPDHSQYTINGREWISREQLSDKFIEKLNETDYDYFIRCLTKLQSHPYSNRSRAFLDSYSNLLTGQSDSLQLPEIIHDEETGQIYTHRIERRRELKISVKTVLNGTGKIDIDGRDILYFNHPYLRANIFMPLRIAGMQDKVDIYAKTVFRPPELHDPRIHGPSSMSTAIRTSLSLSLAAYLDSDVRERLRLAGLLEIDIRLKERKKFGQMKARRKYTWKKR